MTDPYEILGVAPEASEAEVKRAFKQRVRTLHPDANPDDPDAVTRFQAVVEAQALLLDPERRLQLDQQRLVASSRPRRARSAPREPTVGERVGGLVGKAWQQVRGKHGRDLEETVAIDLEDVARGVELERDVPTFVRCDACDARGERRGTPCTGCDGSGYLSRLEPLRIIVPPGAEAGQRIRYRGRGLPGSDGKPGELFVVVEVRSHPLLRRDGRDVHCRVPVRLDDAAGGAEVAVPTVWGLVRIPIPPGTPSGKILRLRERGLPSLGGKGRGDQLVEVVIEVPVGLAGDQLALLGAFYAATTPGQLPERDAYQRALDGLYDD